jgi:hypothetical protein
MDSNAIESNSIQTRISGMRHLYKDDSGKRHLAKEKAKTDIKGSESSDSVVYIAVRIDYLDSMFG